MSDQHKISDIHLDEASFIRRSDTVEAERAIAIQDLLKSNHFALVSSNDETFAGPYHLRLSIEDNDLIILVSDSGDRQLKRMRISLKPFRTVVKEYFMICDSYYKALKDASPTKIEAIDMGRKSIHNDGAALLMERLQNQVELDDATARRLFTLVCVLHIRV